MTYREVLSAIAVMMTVATFYPYIRGILRGNVRPHMFSWVIWGSATLLVFLAQLQAGAGAGAWSTGASAAFTLGIAGLAWRQRADLHITRVDWAFLVAAMSSLPLWYFTADPTAAVVVLTVVILLGYGPTLRKIHHQPRSESITFFALFVLRNVLVVLAMEQWSLATLLFPCAVSSAGLVVITLIVKRRRALARRHRNEPLALEISDEPK